MSSTLLTHRGSIRITRDELAQLPVPMQTDTHKPVSHIELVSNLHRLLKFFEYDVRKEEYAIQRNGNMLFGVIDFAWDGETCSSLGFHTSTNKALALKIATGARVLVCDNLALSGDLIALYRRHTSHFDLTTELMKAIRRYKERQPGFLSQFAALKDHRLTMLEASGRLLELFRARILPLKLFHQVVKDTAQQERTLWNMLMVTTSAVKQLPRAAV